MVTSLLSLSVKNYKAFKDAYIPIKPITIFLGANSIGKSSIIQLLLLLKQTAQEDNRSYKSVFKLYGDYVNLGDPINLFHRLDTNIPFELSLQIYSSKLKRELCNLLATFKKYIIDFFWYFPSEDIKFEELRKLEKLEKESFFNTLDRMKLILTREKEKSNNEERHYFFLDESNIVNYSELLYDDEDNIKIRKTYNFLEELSEKLEDSNSFNFSFKIRYKNKKIYLSEITISESNLNIASILLTEENKLILNSDYVNINQVEVEKFSSYFYRTNPLFSCIRTSPELNKDKPTIIRCLGYIFEKSLSELKTVFSTNRINYVSPLRAHPKRYYMLDKANVYDTLDTLDGDAIAEVLKDKATLKQRVNSWLKNFGLSVDVEEFKEVIHHLKVTQNELDLNIKDVGFGISQILPVIIQGFLSTTNSIVMMEQPEIHLHPKMQADLSDLFIETIKGKPNKRLIIETHSEYLLRRLRRRIAEQKDISNDEVAICMFYSEENTLNTCIKVLDINKTGYFEWPKEFYGGEIYNDTVEFLKLQ